MLGCDGPSDGSCPGNNWYHPKCVGLGNKSALDKAKKSPTWYCRQCLINKTRREAGGGGQRLVLGCRGDDNDADNDDDDASSLSSLPRQ